MSLGLIGLCLILSLSLILVLHPDPVVVMVKDNERIFTNGRHVPVKIDEADVKQFVTEFVMARYKWRMLDPLQIASELGPISTSGLQKKIQLQLTTLKEHDFKDKKVSQSVLNIQVDVTEKNVIATFDRLLKVEGTPLPIPTKISLSIISGSQTKWNPTGLYVNGITEHPFR